MFDLNVRFQVAALCFYIILAVSYSRLKKLPLLSTKCFTLMLVANGVNLVLDMLTVYTLTYIDTVPEWLNELAHRLFYISIAIVPVFFFTYLTFLANGQKRFRKKTLILLFVPIVVAVLSICLFSIRYINQPTTETIYSSGPSVYVLYGSIIFYLTLTIVNIERLNLEKDKRKTAYSGIGILTLFTVVQFFFPNLLLSGLGMTAMTFVVYLSFENPREFIDDETGVFNKRAFHLVLSEDVGKNDPFYVVSIVIMNLSSLNNRYGRVKSNLLMRKIAEFLSRKAACRVYHSRGNTLTLMIPAGETDIYKFTSEIRERLSESWLVSRTQILIKAEVEVIEYPKYASTPDDICDLMNFMIQRTGSGDCVDVVFMNDDIIKSQKRYLLVENIVSDAVRNNGLNVVYQPIFSVKENAFVSAEALVRLKDTQTAGYISPDEFIRIAEEKGLIMELGAIVFEKVCNFVSRNKLEQLGIKYIEVNLSGVQCSDAGIASQLKEILDKYGLPPEMINLEITETASIESGYSLEKNAKQLRQMGCSFSMDDFGTGYSNLSQIADFQYDLIKLDKSLIWPCFDDDNKKAEVILRNVVNMISQLKMKIVAEGVESREQVDFLRDMDIDYLQGYYYSRPISEYDFITYLQEHTEENVTM